MSESAAAEQVVAPGRAMKRGVGDDDGIDLVGRDGGEEVVGIDAEAGATVGAPVRVEPGSAWASTRATLAAPRWAWSTAAASCTAPRSEKWREG